MFNGYLDMILVGKWYSLTSRDLKRDGSEESSWLVAYIDGP
jgi:hypothetical protein